MADFDAKIGVAKSDKGWEITYDGIFEPEDMHLRIFKTKKDALAAASVVRAEWRMWNKRGLSDAPHMDNF